MTHHNQNGSGKPPLAKSRGLRVVLTGYLLAKKAGHHSDKIERGIRLLENEIKIAEDEERSLQSSQVLNAQEESDRDAIDGIQEGVSTSREHGYFMPCLREFFIGLTYLIICMFLVIIIYEIAYVFAAYYLFLSEWINSDFDTFRANIYVEFKMEQTKPSNFTSRVFIGVLYGSGFGLIFVVLRVLTGDWPHRD